MVQIGIDARLIDTAGVRRYLEGIIQHLPTVDPQGQYIIYFSSPKQLARYPLNQPNVKPVVLPANSYSIKEQWYLPYRIRKDGLDIFHATYDFCLPLAQPCKLVATIHDAFITPDDNQYYRSFLTRCYGRGLTHYAMKSAASIITVSNFIKQKISAHLPQVVPKIKVIPSGLEPRFQPLDNPQTIQELKRKYDLPPRYILYLGSFKKNKNLPCLIEAFAGLPQAMQEEYPLVLAGKPSHQHETLQGLAKQAGIEKQVKFLGFVPDPELPALYNAATLFVFPSTHEGFGFPLLEAMACGTPVISANAASMPEIAGQAAILVDKASAEELRAAMLRLIRNPSLRAELAARGLKQARKFSWDNTARQTVKLYHEQFLVKHK